jgi:DNA-binding FadR family transcriptional regulator
MMTMRLPERVAHSLEKAILRGEFPEGCRLPPERELAERYRVSRSTIREAVGKLAQLGLVATQPQSGTYVTRYLTEGSLDLLLHLMRHSETVDPEVVISMMEFRKMSELHAVRKAVERACRGDIEHLREIVRRESLPSTGFTSMAECDYELHAAIIGLSDNLLLKLLFNSFKPVYRFYTDYFFRLPGAIRRTVSQHRRLVEALARRDARAAAAIMEELLAYGERMVVAGLGIADGKAAAAAEGNKGGAPASRHAG